MALKLVWAYGIAVMVGGLGLLLYLKWQDSSSWFSFAAWMVGMVVAVGIGMRRGLERRRALDDEGSEQQQ